MQFHCSSANRIFSFVQSNKPLTDYHMYYAKNLTFVEDIFSAVIFTNGSDKTVATTNVRPVATGVGARSSKGIVMDLTTSGSSDKLLFIVAFELPIAGIHRPGSTLYFTGRSNWQ